MKTTLSLILSVCTGVRAEEDRGRKRLRGILRKSKTRASSAQPGRHVQWNEQLVFEIDEAAEMRNADVEQRRLDDHLAANNDRVRLYRSLRLPSLTVEELCIPMRLAFPATFVYTPWIIALDVAMDVLELAAIGATLTDARLRKSKVSPEVSTLSADEEGTVTYTSLQLARDLLVIVIFHSGRALYLLGGLPQLWVTAQFLRCVRVSDLVQYLREMNGDLSTNVQFLAAFKFTFVLYSVPHWIACFWWLISKHDPEGASLALPSWAAQLSLFTGNDALDPSVASDWHAYLMCLYMSWSGMTALGYGKFQLLKRQELIFAIAISCAQIVFYAFVLGTLFHYLVRVDENTAQFKELLKALEGYCEKREFPVPLARKIRKHFEFQHQKQASGTQSIFAQMPMSLKVRVASARFFRQVQSTWIFAGCNMQFINAIVTALKERHVMPADTIFREGDGARELLWCVGGSLEVHKGADTHIAIIRSDMGFGHVVGELSFITGIQQPYTVAATASGDVTLLVLSQADYEWAVTMYPEQAEVVSQQVLRRYGIDAFGEELDMGGGIASLTEEELEEFESIRARIKAAIIEKKEDAITHMFFAAKEGDVEAVRAFASRNLDLNATNYDGRTTLHLAAAEGNAKVVALLCELGADPNVRDRYGSTPTQEAIGEGHTAVAVQLRKHGAELDHVRAGELLIDAATKGKVAEIEDLLSFGIDIDATDVDGRTPLSLASAIGDMRVVEFLLASLADVHHNDRWGDTPVDDALRNEHRLVAQLHLDRGASPNTDLLFDKLCVAAADGDAERVRFLVDAGSPVNKGDYDARTPLHLACCAGSISTAHFLIGATADVNACDRWGSPAIVDALKHSVEVAGILIHHCNAKLPEDRDCEWDQEILDLYKQARACDMYTVSTELGKRKEERMRIGKARQTSRREIALALKGFIRHLGDFASVQSRVLHQLSEQAQGWVDAYADDMSDVDSQDALSDASWCSSEEDDEGRVDESKPGAHDAAAARHMRRRQSTTSSAGSGVGASNGVADDQLQRTFIRLLLQIPKAEAGLLLLRDSFEASLTPALFARLPLAERREQEVDALRGIITTVCGFLPEVVEDIVEEIFSGLANLLGESAPRRGDNEDVHEQAASPHISTRMSRTLLGSFDVAPANAGAPWRNRKLSSEVKESKPADSGSPKRTTFQKVSMVFSRKSERASASETEPVDLKRSSSGSSVKPALYSSTPESDNSSEGHSAATPDHRGILFISDLGFITLFFSDSFMSHMQNLSPELQSTSRDAARTRDAGVRKSSGSDGSACSVMVDTRSGALVAVGAGCRLHPGSCQSAPASDAVPSEPAGLHRAPPSIVHAAAVLRGLFASFDSSGTGKVKLRTIKALQGELGDQGSQIKSLIDHLIDAASTFESPPDADDAGDAGADVAEGGRVEQSASFRSLPQNLLSRKASAAAMNTEGAHDEGVPTHDTKPSAQSDTKSLALLEQRRASAVSNASVQRRASLSSRSRHGSMGMANIGLQVQRKPKTLSRIQFFVGAAAWILASGEDNDVLDDSEHGVEQPRENMQGSLNEEEVSKLKLQLTPLGKPPDSTTPDSQAKGDDGAGTMAPEVQDTASADRSWLASAVRAWNLLRRRKPEPADDAQFVPANKEVQQGASVAWYILPHKSRKWAYFHAAFITIVSWDALTIPIYFSFLDETRHLEWYWFICYVVDAFLVIRVLMRFFVTHENEKHATVHDPRAIRAYYLSHEFPADLAAAWPHDLVALALGNGTMAVMALRTIKLINVRYVIREYRNFESRKSDDSLLVGLVQYILLVLATSHYCACVWNVLGYSGAASIVEVAWPTLSAEDAAIVYGRPDVDKSLGLDAFYDQAPPWELKLLDRYIVAMYTVISMLTTLGMESMPANYFEICFMLFLMLLNFTVYALAVGQISALVMRQDDEVVNKRGQLELVQVYLSHVRVPAELASQIEGFFRARLRNASLSAVTDEQIYDAMPVSLQIEVSTFTNRELVGYCLLLRSCSPAFIDSLSALLRSRAVEPETILHRPGDVCSELLVIEKGAVHLYDEGAAKDADPSSSLHVGETVGDLPFVFGLRHVDLAQTTSDGETKLFSLATESLKSLLKSFPKEEDILMDNAMAAHHNAGMMSARSGKSGKSGKSSKSGKSRDAQSHASSALTKKSTSASNAQTSIEQIIINARNKRQALTTVRLCGACAKGEVEKVRSIISANDVDLDLGDTEQRRPIHLAACCGHQDIIEVLIQSGADVNVKSRNGATPLHDALYHHQDDAAKLLLSHGAERLDTAIAKKMCIAAHDPEGTEDLKYLVSFDSTEVNAVNHSLRSALHVAAAEGNVDSVRLLVEEMADVNAVDSRGSTPLQDAFHGDHSACAKILLAEGAGMGEFDSAVNFCQAAADNDIAMLQRLVDYRCDVNLGDYDKRTALHLAVSCGQVDATHFLLKLPDIDVNVEDRYGNTPLDDAMRETAPDVAIVRTLLSSRGAKTGSHAPMQADSDGGNLETKLAQAASLAVEEERSQLPVISEIADYAREEAKAARKFHHQVHDAIDLERAEGRVITSQVPLFWFEVRSFAQDHHQRLAKFLGLQETAKGWQEKFRDFAASETKELNLKLAHVVHGLRTASQPLEALSEARFDIKRGSSMETKSILMAM
mmetsp:Transcript_10944/g.32500  ORF Transcript_10944/g.32500 Transcript_10944/m.32500 type:complete len:2648 (+) Transcript_10944:3-7946(+)